MTRQFVTSSVFTASLIFGVFPFKRVANMNYVFSWTLFSYTILVSFLTCGQTVFWIYYTFSRLSISLTLILDFFGNLYFFSTWITIISLYFLNREELPAIIAELYEVYISHNDMVSNSRQYVVFIFITLAVNSMPRFIMLFTNPDSVSSWINPLNIFLYFVFTSIPVLVAAQYGVLLNLLSDRLFSMTCQLKKSEFGLEVHHFVETHHKLCMLSARLNKVYDSFLFQFLAMQFIGVIIKMYIIVVCFAKPSAYSNATRLMNSLFALFVTVGNIVNVVTAAVGAANNAKRFNSQLFDKMLASKNLGKDNSLRTYISMDFNINQTAYDLDLKYPLLTSMVAASATYVILLVQLTLLQ